jgi:hypothetical protein
LISGNVRALADSIGIPRRITMFSGFHVDFLRYVAQRSVRLRAGTPHSPETTMTLKQTAGRLKMGTAGSLGKKLRILGGNER